MKTEFETNDETKLRDCYLTSIEVAEIVGKAHNELLKDIRRYIGQFNKGNLSYVDFFKNSTYQDAKGEERPCYNISKKGCDFIANKLTGVKGTQFTAAYINKFHEMEEELQRKKKQEYEEQQKQKCKAKQEDIKNEFAKRPKVDKFFIRMNRRYKMLEEHFGITRSKLYSQIYHNLESTLGIDVNEIYEDYCISNCISPTECYIMTALEANEAIREAIETMINEAIVVNKIATMEELMHIDNLFSIGTTAAAG